MIPMSNLRLIQYVSAVRNDNKMAWPLALAVCLLLLAAGGIGCNRNPAKQLAQKASLDDSSSVGDSSDDSNHGQYLDELAGNGGYVGYRYGPVNVPGAGKTYAKCSDTLTEVANSGWVTDGKKDQRYFYLKSNGCGKFQLRAKYYNYSSSTTTDQAVLVEGLEDLFDDRVRNYVVFGNSPVQNPTYTYSYYTYGLYCPPPPPLPPPGFPLPPPAPCKYVVNGTATATASTASDNYVIYYAFALVDVSGHVWVSTYNYPTAGGFKAMKDVTDLANSDRLFESLTSLEWTSSQLKISGEARINGKLKDSALCYDGSSWKEC